MSWRPIVQPRTLMGPRWRFRHVDARAGVAVLSGRHDGEPEVRLRAVVVRGRARFVIEKRELEHNVAEDP